MIFEKVGNYAQTLQQSKPIDAVAVVAGFAVWAQEIPMWVGLFTILWLGMQMIINMPRMFRALKHMFRNVFKWKCDCELCEPKE